MRTRLYKSAHINKKRLQYNSVVIYVSYYMTFRIRSFECNNVKTMMTTSVILSGGGVSNLQRVELV